ncbi:hypothetical protein FQZ97_914870 [compost metagenome]
MAAEACLVALALLQQVGIQAHAGIHQEHAVVHQPHLHGPGLLREQHLQRLRRVARDAVGAAEIVEGALRQHAEGAAAAQRGLGHGVDGAVAARGHHHAAHGPGTFDRLARQRLHTAGAVHEEHAVPAAVCGKGVIDDLAGLRSALAAGAGVEHDEERSVGADVGRCHAVREGESAGKCRKRRETQKSVRGRALSHSRAGCRGSRHPERLWERCPPANVKSSPFAACAAPPSRPMSGPRRRPASC